MEPWAFRQWASTARAGETLIYYVGHLARDRWDYAKDKPILPLNALAEVVMDLAKKGTVLLSQRRVSDPRRAYQYLATRRA